MMIRLNQAAVLLLLLTTGPPGALAAPGHFRAGQRREPGPHPRTLLLPSQRAGIQARLGREPYTTLLKRVSSWASRSQDPGNHEVGPVQSTANTARAAALLVYLDRKVCASGKPCPFVSEKERGVMGQKAASYLVAMKTTSRAKGALGYIKDIHTAQELHMWADALDLLLGASPAVLSAGDKAQAVQNLADLAADFYADFTSYPNYLLTRSLINNHRAKSAGALGLAALVLNGETFTAKAADGRYDPARWIDFAMRYADMCGRDILTDADYGYQEGVAYLAYGNIDLMGLLWAWHNYAGGSPYQVDWSPGVVPYYRFHSQGTYTIPDLWRSAWLEGQLRWAARLILPDGTMPGFDDNSPGSRPFFFGALVQPGVASAPLFRWAWRRGGYYSGGSVDQAPLLLVTFDDSVEEAAPPASGLKPAQAMPYAGQVIFRSGWGADDTYALILAEHGRAAGWAQNRWGDFIDGAAGHEHPDPGAFSLFAHGEHLAIDSGYMGWDNHALVNGADNHNILLVDGKGPQLYRLVIPETKVELGKVTLKRPDQEGGWAPAKDGMAYLTARDITTTGVQMAEVLTRYSVNVPMTDIRRRATFLAGRFLVIHDEARTEYKGAGTSLDRHSYTFQLHGNGGGTSGGTFQRLGDGGLWTRPNARLRALLSAQQSLAITTRLATHDPGNRQPKTHTVLEGTVEARRGDAVEFIALLATEKSDQAGGIVKTAACRPGPCIRWSSGAAECTAWSGSRREVKSKGAGAPPLMEAGGGAFCLDGGELYGVFHQVGAKDGPLISGRFSLDSAGRASAYDLKIHRAGEGAPLAKLDLPAVAGRAPAGACTYSTSTRRWPPGKIEERWRITIPTPGNVATGPRLVLPVAHIGSPSLKEGLPSTFSLGAMVKLSSSATCAGSAAVRRWRVTSRPELSSLQVTGSQAAHVDIDLRPDLPGVYRVELTVVTARGESMASLEFEVEGELTWPGARDAGLDHGGSSGDGLQDGPAPPADGGCGGCAAVHGSDTSAWILIGALLLLIRRRGQRI